MGGILNVVRACPKTQSNYSNYATSVQSPINLKISHFPHRAV
jgi:hypothetical protein